MSYEPWVGKLDDGTEVLVTVQNAVGCSVIEGAYSALVQTLEVAFRPVGARTWGPPCQLERAP